MQSPYMTREMVLEVQSDVNPGFVTDACHGFFHDDRKYLFVTSSYSIRLRGWIPVFLAYSGGQDVGHYRHYFRLLFTSLKHEVGTQFQIRDENYAQVCAPCSLLIVP